MRTTAVLRPAAAIACSRRQSLIPHPFTFLCADFMEAEGGRQRPLQDLTDPQLDAMIAALEERVARQAAELEILRCAESTLTHLVKKLDMIPLKGCAHQAML